MKILSYKVQKDGSAKMSYSLTNNEIELFKIIAKQRNKKISKSFCNKIVLESITNYLREK